MATYLLAETSSQMAEFLQDFVMDGTYTLMTYTGSRRSRLHVGYPHQSQRGTDSSRAKDVLLTCKGVPLTQGDAAVETPEGMGGQPGSGDGALP